MVPWFSNRPFFVMFTPPLALSLVLAFFAPEFEPRDAFGAYDPAGAVLIGWLKDVLPDPQRDWPSGLFILGIFVVYFGIIYGLVRLVVSLVNGAKRGAVRPPGEAGPPPPTPPGRGG